MLIVWDGRGLNVSQYADCVGWKGLERQYADCVGWKGLERQSVC